jgi:Tol biopolymer transport system component
MGRSRRFVAFCVALGAQGVAPAQTTTRVSVDSSGAEANKDSDWPTVSANGRYVAFGSNASNLVAGDSNATTDVFVYDRSTGTTERVSVDSSGAEGNGGGLGPFAISADGRFVAFASQATNLVAGDTNNAVDIFVRDRSAGTTERVSVDSSGAQALGTGCVRPGISADGNVVVFESSAANLVAGDTNGVNDVFVHVRSTGVTERVSVDSSGAEANDWSGQTSISADGGVVGFSSFATNLVPGDTNGYQDIFVHDRSTGITERVSVDSSGAQAVRQSQEPAISADGQLAAFSSLASNLVPGDTNNQYDVFVHDRLSGTTELVSVDSAGVQGNNSGGSPSITPDGRVVAFYSDASNLVVGDVNGWGDIFVHDRSSGITERVSVDTSGTEADSASFRTSISADGQIVAFGSVASNLVSGDTNAVEDCFVRDRQKAMWSNYGAGFPGTQGIPSFTSQSDPVLGTTITLDLANSAGSPTAGLIFVGFQRADFHTNRGGDLLVSSVLLVPVTFSSGGDSIDWSIPNDATLAGIAVDAQALEADPGAAKSVSFTPGLELVLGY